MPRIETLQEACNFFQSQYPFQLKFRTTLAGTSIAVCPHCDRVIGHTRRSESVSNHAHARQFVRAANHAASHVSIP